MSFTFRGLVFGDTGTGWASPTYAQLREGFADYLRELRQLAWLNTSPGSFFGEIVDFATTCVDLSLQADSEAVSRTLFTSAGGVSLDQLVAPATERVQASPSTATVWAYGTAGGTALMGSAIRATATSTAFTLDAPITIPAAPAEAYGVEIGNFAAGAFNGQPFTVTVDGTPVPYVPGPADTGETTRNGLVTAINAAGLTQVGWRGGQSPTAPNRWLLMVIEDQGVGVFPLSVAGPVGQILAFPADSAGATASTSGPTAANAESLRVGPPFANITGYTNVEAAVLGLTQETNSQLRARHQIGQRGQGGGNPDAIRAIVLAQVAIGGGGATFCSVEYNPEDVIDPVTLNVPHSIRVIVNSDANVPDVALAIWRAKAAGDDMNGAVVQVIQDQVGNDQTVLFDLLQDQFIGVAITIATGPDWPVNGDPLAQLRQDVADYIEALQPNSEGNGVRPNLLPISTYPDGSSRGVVNFTVAIGVGPSGGPFVYQDTYPTIEPNADLASVILTSRQKARCNVADVQAVIP